MSEIKPRKLKLRNNQEVTIESATEQHAQWFKDFNDVIFSESEFLYPATQEKKSLEECTQQIQVFQKSPKDLMLILHNEKQAMGMLNCRVFPQKPISHNADFGVAVRKEFRGLGIGKVLMKVLTDHLKLDKSITRLQMSVVAKNLPAIQMYTKLGFEKEGLRIKAVKSWDGHFYDELLMAKII